MDIQNLMGLTSGQQNLNVTPQKDTNFVTLSTEGTDTGSTIDATQTVGEEFSTFLTLLTAQIRNQDPLAPLDSTQFVEQLATFSSLELEAKSNVLLENIATMLAQNLYTQNNEAPVLNDLT